MNYFILVESKLDYFRVLIIAHKMGYYFKYNQLINSSDFSPYIYLIGNVISFDKDKTLSYSNIYSSDFIRKFDDCFTDITIPSLSFYLNRFNNQIIMNNFKFSTYKKDPISFSFLTFKECLMLREDYLLEIIIKDIESSIFVFKIIHIVDLINTIILYLRNFDVEKLKLLYKDNREDLLLDFSFHKKQLNKKYSISYFKILIDKMITNFFNDNYPLSHKIDQLDFYSKDDSFFSSLFSKSKIPSSNYLYLLNQIN